MYVTATSVAIACAHLYLIFSVHILLSTQSVVRGGIEINGSFSYQIEPRACIDVDFLPRVAVTPCAAIYDAWPSSYVDLYAYYQARKFKAKWPVSVCTW